MNKWKSALGCKGKRYRQNSQCKRNVVKPEIIANRTEKALGPEVLSHLAEIEASFIRRQGMTLHTASEFVCWTVVTRVGLYKCMGQHAQRKTAI